MAAPLSVKQLGRVRFPSSTQCYVRVLRMVSNYMILKLCSKCSKEFDSYSKWGEKKFCSRTCANSRIVSAESNLQRRTTLSGRTLSEEHIKNISGDNHPKRKGKNLPKYIDKNCLCCGKKFSSNKDANKCCSRACVDANFKSLRSKWNQYKLECKFKFNVYDYPTLIDLTLISEHGWYKASNRGNNLNGISRDHSYSVKEGFKNNIDPKIISHPANCVLMKQSDNSSKKTKCNITIEKLLERICVVGREYEGSSLQN